MAVQGLSAQTDIFKTASPKPLDGTNSNAFGQDAFLKLLVTQLRFQDPSEPVDNEQFLGQMAQFTSVEQIVSLNKSIQNLAGASLKADAVTLLGTDVVIRPVDQVVKEGSAPVEITGMVQQVQFLDNGVKLTVNGKEYSMEEVVRVKVPEILNSVF